MSLVDESGAIVNSIGGVSLDPVETEIQIMDIDGQ